MSQENSHKTADLLLVDGNSIINRAFFAMARNTQRFTAPDGTPTGAVFTFFNILFSYIDELKPPQICVCFDSKGPTFRHEFYPEYKAGRRAMDEDLVQQIPLAKEGLDYLGYSRMEAPGYEADDLIASLCRRAEKAGKNVYVLSGDRDLWQLISEQTTLIYPYSNKKGGGRSYMDPAAFEEAFGFKAVNLLDYKALRGDSSDNIPGVKGIGEKTATDLIQKFTTVENVYANIDKITGAKKTRLQEGHEQAQLSYKLARLNFEAPVEDCPPNREIQKVELEDFLTRLNINSLRKRFGLEQSEQIKALERKVRAKLQGELSALNTTSYIYVLEIGPYIALVDEEAQVLLRGQENFAEIWQACLEKDLKLVLWAAKEFLRRYDLLIPQKPPLDLEILAYLLNLGKLELDYPHNLLSVFKDLFQLEDTFQELPAETELEDFAQAAAERAEVYKQVQGELLKRLESQNMKDLAFSLELPLSLILARMEKRGIKVNQEATKDLSREMQAEEEALKEEAAKFFPREINLNSSKQLGEVLFKDLGLKGAKKTKSGNYSTAADVLQGIVHEHPVIPVVLRYREVSKLRSTFVDGLAKEIAEDGRVHTHFKQTLTSTGRLSSAEPNLQNIPVKSEHSTAIRKLFVASDSCSFLDADYSQIELRLLAVLSGDEVLLESYRAGEDIHRSTAARIFNKAPEDITSLERRAAKTVNFSIIYGISEFSLAQDLEISLQSAKNYIDSYHAHYPQVLPWMQAQVDFAKKYGYVETLLGRRRYIPELKSKNFHQRKFGERAAMNAPVQGSAADLIKMAMVKVEENLADAGIAARQLLQVHDELLLEVRDESLPQAAKILRESMETAMDLCLPLKVELESGKTWGSMKKID